MNDTLTVEIPEDVRDNSETVTDYAFMRHRSPDRGVVTPQERDNAIAVAAKYFPGYSHYQWHDVNQGNRQGWGAGQRCRFDMIVNADGQVVDLFHTEYWTRVACHTGGWCHSYAAHYALVTMDGEPTTDGPLPYCDEHIRTIRETAERRADVTLHLSERLLVGQHD